MDGSAQGGYDANGNPVSWFSDDSSSAANTSTDNANAAQPGNNNANAAQPGNNNANAAQPGNNNANAAQPANRIPAGPGPLVNSTSANFPQTEAQRSATLGYTPLPKSISDNAGKLSDLLDKKKK